MRIILVEDDARQASTVAEYLSNYFDGTEVVCLQNELAFNEWLSTVNTLDTDLVVLDMMIRWASPAPSMFYDSPYDGNPGFTRGGARCVARLRGTPSAANVPVIIYSVLERHDYMNEIGSLPPHYSILRKTGDPAALALHISSVYPNLTRTRSTFMQRLREAVTATVRAGPFSVDLKKLFSKKR